MGFVQTPTVTEPGDYAVRGGIIDVWPPGEPTPVRLDLSATCWTARAASTR
jgi:transcription-repair coupling factor (superfamily II helicase)